KHLRDVASALALLHSRRLLHRDITPRNVRLTEQGRAKLIDFGTLAAFGTTNEIVGTPSFIAPEAVYGAALDQRADLFSLGALAYWLLTGQRAYPARSLRELPFCWKSPPPPPSGLVSGIPPELEALVMSLLRVDPLARPSSAAAVIEALTSVADLEVEERQREAESYLASCALVARDDELQRLRASLTRAVEGRGSAVLIEAEAGMGKTRLLRELALEAQLQSATVLLVNAREEAGAYGVARSLGLALLRALPEEAVRESKPYAGVLGHLSEELHRRLGGGALEAVPALLSEGRARILDALQRWMLAVSTHQPLLVAVDNVHLADENSAAFVAALAKEARTRRLLIAATLSPSHEKRSASSVRILRQGATRVRLGNLRASQVNELVRSLFGNPAHTSRFAKWLYERSAGSPFECLELARYAVSREIIKYVDGAWILPQELAGIDLPSRLDDVLAARISRLSPKARELAGALSIEPGNVSLERCLLLAEGMAERETYAALDELVAEDILAGAREGYRFSHEALRQTLERAMPEAARQQLHRRVADVLLTRTKTDPGTRFEAAFHLVSAGDRSRGADLLAETGLDPQLSREHVEQTVRGLQTALEIYEAEGRSNYHTVPVLLQLCILSYYVDWRLVQQYGERAVDLGFELTGLTLAHRLRRFLGAKLALVVALIVTGVRFARARRKTGAKASLKETITLACTAGPAVLGVAATCMDAETSGRLILRLRPLRYFGQRHVGGVLYEFCSCLHQLNLGRLHVYERLRKVTEVLATPGTVKGLSESARKAFYAGALISQATQEVGRLDGRSLETADRVEALGLKLFASGADQIRFLYHASRGEVDLAERYRERIELHAVQGGSTWQAEIFVPVVMGIPAIVTRDVIAARRCYELVEQQAKGIPSLAIHASHMRALYLFLRGETRASLELCEQVVQGWQPRQRIMWQYPFGLQAAILNGLGEHARARDVCLDALRRRTPEDAAFVVFFAELERELALAEVGLGATAEAAQRIDAALAASATADNPLYLGTLHRTRAEIALAAEDAERFREHLDAMGAWVRRTANPTLILQWERLMDAGLRSGVLSERLGDPESAIGPSTGGRSTGEYPSARTIIAADDVDARSFSDLLLKVLDQAQANHGFLYLARAGGVELAAQRAVGEPPEWLWDEVAESIRNLEDRLESSTSHERSARSHQEYSGDVSADESDVTITIESGAPIQVQMGMHFYRILLLVTHQHAAPKVVGAVALELDPQAPANFRTESLARVADAIADLMNRAPSAARSEPPVPRTLAT
ncbi:MAG TPA: AAA family ATPase, partial [Polyangiaceae bacterium]